MAGYAKMRGGRPGIRGALIQVEPRMSLTGASADEWVAIKPGTEGVLALGLANALGAKNLGAVHAGGGREADGRQGRRASNGSRRCSPSMKPAVAVIAGAPLAQTNGLFQATAVNVLNQALGAVDAPGGLSFTPQAHVEGRSPRSLQTLASDILAGKGAAVQALLVDGVNPVHTTPPGWKVKDALAKIPYIVSFGSFADDTSVMADLILPDHSALESWTDSRPESGTTKAIVTVAGPAMKPLHDTRATADVLLDVAKKLKKPLAALPESFERDASGVGRWRRRVVDGDEAGVGRRSRAKSRRPRAKEHEPPSPQPEPASPVVRRRSRRSIPSTSCRSRRRRFSTGRRRTCRGCRRCPIRSAPRCGARGSRSTRRRRRSSASATAT